MLALAIKHRINALGGYGPAGEVIYEQHPVACPSVLVDSRGNASCTLMSNGSVAFSVRISEGLDVTVLAGSFDNVLKRELGAPSANVWLSIPRGGRRLVSSLINGNAARGLAPERIKVVKTGGPDRSIWYCMYFRVAGGRRFESAVKCSLVMTAKGPALARQIFVCNRGGKPLVGDLWTCFNLHSTQRFAWDKDLWYDIGLPLSKTETVVAASVPHTRIVQLKRVSSALKNARAVEATCDYTTFVGDSAAYSLLPQAVLAGGLLKSGAGSRLNRFSTPTLAASRFAVRLRPGASASVRQALLYVQDAGSEQQFRQDAMYVEPTFEAMAQAFTRAARRLLARTPDARRILAAAPAGRRAPRWPDFEVTLPAQPAAAHYANSAWTGVEELYEKCRSQGAVLADGIEIGTRDRSQDMWPKLKQEPARVRADLVHAFSFMYVTADAPVAGGKRLSLPQKLQGMFPRQFPSRWLDRSKEVHNDNRPYADSALWPINSLCMYIRETGDLSILLEEVGTVRLTNPEDPAHSGIVGAERRQRLVDAVFEIFGCFERHVADSPYGLAQVMYGDWCDPVDMFGTSVVGDARTRGMGRGGQVRLSAHLFLTLVEVIDLLSAGRVASALAGADLSARLERLKRLAGRLRQNVISVGWEDGPAGFPAGFIALLHELKRDGSTPAYNNGETGYTLGSMLGRDFDGVNRRELTAQAFGLAMLATERDYLPPFPQRDEMLRKLLDTVDTLFFDPNLGLPLFTAPIANNDDAIRLVGRIGMVAAGCAENGEYHHGQLFMHRFRLWLPGQADTVWRQMKPVMSAMRDESIGGPFETPCTSYASARGDPHFGKAMYFGLSGSVDWLVEVFQEFAGLELSLHDEPAIRIAPNLPSELQHSLTFRRIIHQHTAAGWRQIPLRVAIRKRGRGSRITGSLVKVNGKRCEAPLVQTVAGLDRVHIEITYLLG